MVSDRVDVGMMQLVRSMQIALIVYLPSLEFICLWSWSTHLLSINSNTQKTGPVILLPPSLGGLLYGVEENEVHLHFVSYFEVLERGICAPWGFVNDGSRAAQPEMML